MVVGVSAISYGSYVLQRLTKGHGGLLLAALFGGAYSSTVTTVVLARRAGREDRSYLFSGAMLMASGVMYLRLAALLALFNQELATPAGAVFAVLAALAIGAGWVWSRRDTATENPVAREYEPTNPLELRAALLFALLFLAMLVATHVAVVSLGKPGVYTLAALMGVTDVDPFILGITQATPALTPLNLAAAAAILVAAASNNIAKGVYAFVLAPRPTGAKSLLLLLVLAAAGLMPLLWQG